MQVNADFSCAVTLTPDSYEWVDSLQSGVP